MILYTEDSQDYISQCWAHSDHCFVRRAKTKAEAEAEIRKAANRDGLTVSKIGHARLPEALVKTLRRVTKEDIRRVSEHTGIPLKHLSALAPGSHPGGNFWWIVCDADILCATEFEPETDNE